MITYHLLYTKWHPLKCIEQGVTPRLFPVLLSGGSRISRGGGANSPGGLPTYDFAKFSQKLHDIERIWTPGGALVPRDPLRSATATVQYSR